MYKFYLFEIEIDDEEYEAKKKKKKKPQTKKVFGSRTEDGKELHSSNEI